MSQPLDLAHLRRLAVAARQEGPRPDWHMGDGPDCAALIDEISPDVVLALLDRIAEMDTWDRAARDMRIAELEGIVAALKEGR
jgi:hypothetical protein